MSDKHLTEKAWRDLVSRKGVKDLGLLKALAAYARIDATEEPLQAIEALKEISDLALKLKKTCSAKAAVEAYLDEMIKEAKKISPTLEMAEDREDREAAEFKKDLRMKTVSALAQVKARAPGDPEQQQEPKPQLQFMAYLAGRTCAVVIAKKVGAATKRLLPEIAGVASGGRFVRGECIFEKHVHTFVLDDVPGGLARNLAGALFAASGAKYKVRVRSTDGSTELHSDADLDPDAGAPAAAAAESAAEMAQFTARFKALQPDLLKLIAGKSPQAGEAKQHASEAGLLANKKDFAKANQLLDMVDSLLNKGGDSTR